MIAIDGGTSVPRTKQILVLSTGKNVAPAPLEDQFAASEIIEQAMVVGDNEKFVGALLVPNTDHIRSWAESEGIDLPDEPQAMCDNERVREYVRDEVDGANEDFEDYEQIKRFELVPQEFTEENEMLTPTMKKKRRVIMDRFADRIDHIYDEDRLSAPRGLRGDLPARRRLSGPRGVYRCPRQSRPRGGSDDPCPRARRRLAGAREQE